MTTVAHITFLFFYGATAPFAPRPPRYRRFGKIHFSRGKDIALRPTPNPMDQLTIIACRMLG